MIPSACAVRHHNTHNMPHRRGSLGKPLLFLFFDLDDLGVVDRDHDLAELHAADRFHDLVQYLGVNIFVVIPDCHNPKRPVNPTRFPAK